MERTLNRLFPGDYPEVPEGGASGLRAGVVEKVWGWMASRMASCARLVIANPPYPAIPAAHSEARSRYRHGFGRRRVTAHQ
jgi:hypothetical protein